MKIFVLIGAPGSGKGSVSKMLSDNHNVFHLSTGNIFRNLKKDDCPEIKKGLYISDEETNLLVEKHLNEVVQSNKYDYILLDGYPRTINQAEFLENKFQPEMAIYMQNVSDDLIIDRLSNRVLCRMHDHAFDNRKLNGRTTCIYDDSDLYQRQDDAPDAIKQRLEIYRSKTLPVIKWYEIKNKLSKFDGSLSLDETYSDIEKQIVNTKNKN